MPYLLGIDLGVANTRAAVCRWSGRAWAEPEMVPLGPHGSAVESVLFLTVEGTALVGEAAQRRGSAEPARLVRPISRHGGDPGPTPPVGRSWAPAELAARLVRWVIERAAKREGGPARQIAVAHPASWSASHQELLAHELNRLGLSVTLLARPQAVAMHQGRAGRVVWGAPIAVYDLSGNSFEATVVRSGEATLLGRPELLENMSAADLGEPERARPLIEQTVAAVRSVVAAADLVPRRPAAVALIGESTRFPLIRELVLELIGGPVLMDADPENTASRGAAAGLAIDPDRPGARAPDTPDLRPEIVGIEDDAQFTVYRPAHIQPLRWYPLLAFVHRADPFIDPDSGELVDPLELVKSQADRLLQDQSARYRPVTADSELRFPRGTEIILQPWLSDGEVNPTQATFRWEEPAHRFEFRLRAADHAEGRRITGGLRVFLGVLLAGEVSFSIEVSSSSPAEPAQLERVPVRRFRRIFASYSRLDSDVVDSVTRYAAATGDHYLIDTAALRSGERWEPRLIELIERSDIFQLFWSSNAMNSGHVRREWEHALSLRREGFIRPVYWEEPRPTDPDRELPPPAISQLHWARLPVLTIRRGPDVGAQMASASTVGPVPRPTPPPTDSPRRSAGAASPHPDSSATGSSRGRLVRSTIVSTIALAVIALGGASLATTTTVAQSPRPGPAVIAAEHPSEVTMARRAPPKAMAPIEAAPPGGDPVGVQAPPAVDRPRTTRPDIVLSTASARSGESINVSGSGFNPGETVVIRVNTTEVARTEVSETGKFSDVPITVTRDLSSSAPELSNIDVTGQDSVRRARKTIIISG